MGTREVSVSVCGVIMGIILGATSFSAFQAVPLSASVSGTQVAAFFSAPNVQEYTRRRIDEKGLVPNAVSVSSAQSSSSASVSEILFSCDTVKKIVAEMQTAHDKALPATSRNTEARAFLKSKLKEIRTRYCPVQPSSAAAIDNDCEQYGETSLRYTQCKIQEERGMEYRGY